MLDEHNDDERGTLTLRTQAMPKDANINGDIFGGWVLSQMDTGAGVVAGARAQGRVATIAVDAMKFHRPIKVGDVLSVYGKVEREGTTSMGVKLEAWVMRFLSGKRELVTEAMFTFVAIDDEGRPRPLPEEGMVL